MILVTFRQLRSSAPLPQPECAFDDVLAQSNAIENPVRNNVASFFACRNKGAPLPRDNRDCAAVMARIVSELISLKKVINNRTNKSSAFKSR